MAKHILKRRFSGNPDLARHLWESLPTAHDLVEVFGTTFYWKVICLGATERYPQGLFMHTNPVNPGGIDTSHGWRGGETDDAQVIGLRWCGRGRGRRLVRSFQEIDGGSKELQLELARARWGKTLPAFCIDSHRFHGQLEGVYTKVTVDLIRNCPGLMSGCWITLERDGGRAERVLACMGRASVRLIGATEVRDDPRDYEEMLHDFFPTFPWQWTGYPARV